MRETQGLQARVASRKIRFHQAEHPGEIEAAIGSSNMSRLIGPDPGTGPFQGSLAGQKCERVRARIKHAAGGLEIRRVRDVFGLVEAAMSEQALVMGSL